MRAVPSDSYRPICLFCGAKRTVRLGAGLWFRCKVCGKRNPGPSIVGDIVRNAIAAGQVVVGKKVVPAAGARTAAGGSPASKAGPAPSAGTTVGRRAKATVPTAKAPPATKPAPVGPPP